MKYISLRTFEDISSALNFQSAGTRVVGGCDLYTTKAAGDDKKLYKHIDQTLESQHESLLRLAASLSPSQGKELAKTSNLSQSSPFGALSQISNRRTFAFMIATLNASHSDYDFSKVVRPEDFCREKRLNDVMYGLDSKVYTAHSTCIPRGIRTPGGSLMWGPRMWSFINQEMSLYDCQVYSYNPDQNPFDDEETALWSIHYFFFNKAKKRVCYLYARALSPTMPNQDYEDDVDELMVTSQPRQRRKRSFSKRQSADFSSRKRARYWLGDRADDLEDEFDEDDYTQCEAYPAESDDSDDYDYDDEDYDDRLISQVRKLGRRVSYNEAVDNVLGEPR